MGALCALTACAVRTARLEAERRSLRDREFVLAHDGIDRRYRVHVPPTCGAGAPCPVVIYVHGGGGNILSAYMNGMDSAADAHGFILAVPEGTGEVKRGQLRASWNGGAWATGACCGDTDDVGFIAKMIEKLQADFEMDARRVYATGISNGGLMTNRLACELSDKIAAIATVAPAALMSACKPGRAVPIIDVHGTADPANPPDGSEPKGIFNEDSGSGFAKAYKRMTPDQVVARWREMNQCAAESVARTERGPVKCVVHNRCAQGAEVALCMIEGMGHTWPDGLQYLPASMVGPVSHDFSFTHLWEFLSRHSL